MSEKLDQIENVLKSQKIGEYEIYLVERNVFETILLKNKNDVEREIIDFEYLSEFFLNMTMVPVLESSKGIHLIQNSLSEISPGAWRYQR